MDITSYCPLRVASVTWRHLSAATAQESWSITLVVKATYSLRAGESPLAVEQDLPQEADAFWNNDERKSLRVASDLAPFKSRAEFLLIGSAYAPAKRPVELLSARVAVGDLDKTIEVVGDRAFGPDGVITGAGPFARMPLVWERAAGGPGTSNPVGVRLDAPANTYGMTPLPNLLPNGARLVKRGDFTAPVGFAPMASWWPQRAGMLRQHAAGWDYRGWNKRPLPADLDGAHFNTAPLDQRQLEPFQGNEGIHLENLHPSIPRLSTHLQPIRPLAGISRGGALREDLPLLCDTIVIDADRAVCTLIWRAQVRLWHVEEAGQIAVWMEHGRVRAGSKSEITLSGSDEPTFDVAPASAHTALIAAPSGLAPGAALPFSGKTLSDGPVGPAPGSALPFSKTLSDGPVGPAPGSALPFSDGARATPAIVDTPTAPVDLDSDSPETEPAPVLRAPLMVLGGVVALVSPPALAPPPALAMPSRQPSEPPEMSSPFDVPPPALLSAIEPVPEIDAPIGAMELPAPPPLLGPLAWQTTSAPAPSPSPSLEPEERAVEAPAPPPPAADVAVTIEQFAAISAELLEERSSRARILEDHGLTERAWGDAADRWTAQLDRESARGGNKLRTPYDHAYLAAVESFRGPIMLEEYARVVIGLERGGADPVLAKLAIQRQALMSLLRIWTRKVATDPRLADESGELLATLREADDEDE